MVCQGFFAKVEEIRPAFGEELKSFVFVFKKNTQKLFWTLRMQIWESWLQFHF